MNSSLNDWRTCDVILGHRQIFLFFCSPAIIVIFELDLSINDSGKEISNQILIKDRFHKKNYLSNRFALVMHSGRIPNEIVDRGMHLVN